MKNAKQMLRNPVFSDLLAFAPHVSAEDETWRKRLVSVSATPVRGPTGNGNAPPTLLDFARGTPRKRRVIFCRRLFILPVADNFVGG